MQEQLGNISYGMDIDLKSGEAAFNTVNNQAKKTEAQLKKFDTQVNKTAKAVNKGLNQSLTNASYQIQDIAVQLAGGQNVTLVLAQQLPQLLVGLGKAAAGIGAVIAVLGGLYLAFGDSKTAAEKMEKAIEQVKAVMTVGADGVANYTEELRKLERVSEVIAAAKVDAAIVAQETALTEGVKSMEESFRSFGSFYDERAYKIAQNTKLPISAINELEKAMKFPSTGDPAERVKLFESAIDGLRAGLPDANKKGKELFASVVDLVSEFVQGSERLQRLNELVNDTGVSFSNANNKASELTLELLTQKIALEDGDRAALAFKLQMDGLTEAQKQQVLALYDANVATEQSIENSERASQALEDEIDGWIRVGQEVAKAAEQKEKAAARDRERLADRGETVGLTGDQQIKKRYEEDLEALTAALELERITREEFAEREVQIEAEKVARLKALREQEAKNSESFLATYGSALNSINSLFGTYVNSMDKDTKKSFEKWKKYATAQALISTLLAVGNALASPAPWPIPLIMAGVAGAAGAMNVAQIKSQTYDGAREFGGPVTAGKSYLVGERGPEIFTPNSAGGITSNKDMMSGQPTVNIYNVPDSMGAPAVTMDKVNNAIEIRFRAEASNLASGKGPIAKGMKQGAGTRFNATN